MRTLKMNNKIKILIVVPTEGYDTGTARNFTVKKRPLANLTTCSQ